MFELSRDTEISNFVLDDRSLQERLENIQRYVAEIPFAWEDRAFREYRSDDPQAYANFGEAVSISADGSTMAVGEPSALGDMARGEGKVHLFSRKGNTWRWDTTLTGPGDESRLPGAALFGAAVSLDRSGSTLVVGAPNECDDDGRFVGAAYVYMRDGDGWHQSKLQSGALEADARFGSRLCISGDGVTIAVTAPYLNGTPVSWPAVHVYHRSSGTTWSAPTIIKNSQGSGYFAAAVSVDDRGLCMAIGITSSDDHGRIAIYRYDGEAWGQTPSAVITKPFRIGHAISLSGDGKTLAFADRARPDDVNEVFLYRYTGVEWKEDKTLAFDTVEASASSLQTVCLSADGAVLAASMGIGSSTAGIVRLYRRGPDGWRLEKKLTSGKDGALEGQTGDHFGRALSLSADGGIVVAGAPHRKQRGLTDAGAAFVFIVATEAAPSYLAAQHRASLSGNRLVAYSRRFSPGNYLAYASASYPASAPRNDAAADRQAEARYGDAVCISADGCTMAVGEPGREQNGTENCGAVSLFERVDANASWELKATLAVLGEPHEFGCAVSLDADGQTLVVGAHLGTMEVAGETHQTGAAYLYRRGNDNWPTVGEKLLPPEEDSAAEINFGYAVSVSGDGQTIAVGAPDQDGVRADGAGCVYTYGSTGQYVSRINASLNNPGDDLNARFGLSVSLDYTGQILVAGAPYSTGGNSGSGTVHVVSRSESGPWPANAPWKIAGGGLNKNLGHALSLSADGHMLAVSEPGAKYAYIYTCTDPIDTESSWLRQKVLKEPLELAAYGASLSLSADGAYVVVGAKATDTDPGTVYLYKRGAQDANWEPEGQLAPDDVVPGDAFGASVSLSRDGSSWVVGAPLRTVEGIGEDAGTIATSHPVGSGQEPAPVVPDGPQAEAQYGYTVCISADGSTMAVGEPYRSLGDRQKCGAVYLFNWAGDDWEEDIVLSAPAGATSFGQNLALDREGKTLIVGATSSDRVTGRVFVYARSTSDGWDDGNDIDPGGIQPGDLYGMAISISGDGQTIAVGAPDRIQGNDSRGAACLFHRNGGSWTFATWLEIGVHTEDARPMFGCALSLDELGETLAVGAYGFGDGTGAAFIFKKNSGNAWLPTSPPIEGDTPFGLFGVGIRLSHDGSGLAVHATKPDNIQFYTVDDDEWMPSSMVSSSVENDFFGISFSMSDDGRRLAVGAPFGSGAVYLYRLGAGGWQPDEQCPEIHGIEGDNDAFGRSVSLRGDGTYLVVGAPYRALAEVGAKVGAIATFELNELPEPEPELDPQALAQYGYAVCVSADGSTMAVGEPYRSLEERENCGAVYLFNNVDSSWLLDKILDAPADAYAFGCSVRLDTQGKTLVVGASADGDAAKNGAAYVYTRDTAVWNAGVPLEHLSGNRAGDQYGCAVAVSGDGQTIAVGASTRTGGESGRGVVFLFGRNQSGAWVRVKWVATNIATGDVLHDFGEVLSLDELGQTLAVGAPSFGRNADSPKTGAAFIFRRLTDGTWPDEAQYIEGEADSRFGASVSLSGNASCLAVGAPGEKKACLYNYDDEEQRWQPLKVLSGPDKQAPFGTEVSLSADGMCLAVGAARATGEVYLYRHGSDGWQLRQECWVIEGENDELSFGNAISLSDDGNSLAVGAPRQLDDENIQVGAVFTFELDQLPPVPEPEPGPDWLPQALGRLGYAVSISTDGCTMAVGEPGREWDGVVNCGAVYLFDRAADDEQWEAKATLRVQGESHEFGCAVSLDSEGKTLVVGARLGMSTEDANFYDSGAAYLYHRDGDAWPVTGRNLALPRGHRANAMKFGEAVSISGDGLTIAVGSPGRYAGENGAGRVYMYRSDGAYIALLNAENTEHRLNAGFGSSVSLNQTGKILAVGAPRDSEGGEQAGAIYVFEAPPTGSWPGVSAPPALTGTSAQSSFGSAVSLSANGLMLAVGASGSRTVDICTPADESDITGEWTRQKTLDSSTEEDAYGAALSLSADGLCLAVGAKGTDTVSGMVYVYTQDEGGADWSPLEPLDVEVGTGDAFGAAVSLSGNGSRLVAGAPLRPGNVGGEVGAYATFDLAIPETQPEPGPEWVPQAFAQYGYAVCISTDGNTMAVGAPYQDDGNGAVYVFTRDNADWVPRQKLETPALEAPDQIRQFGFALSLDNTGRHLVVGAPNSAVGGRSGAAYAFECADDGQWGAGVSLGGGHSTGDFSKYGFSVSISGDGLVAAVGEPYHKHNNTPMSGVVTMFSRSTGSWGSGSYIPNGHWDHVQENAHFGYSVSLNEDGTIVAGGAPGYLEGGEGGVECGAVFVFRGSLSSWGAPQKIVDAAASHKLGGALRFSAEGNMLAIGELEAGPEALTAVHLWRYEDDAWQPVAHLRSDQPGDQFGCSLSLSADFRTLAIGAKGSDDVTRAVHLYRQGPQGDADWQRLEPLDTADVVRGDAFGAALCLSGDGNSLVVGSPLRPMEDVGEEVGAISSFAIGDLQPVPEEPAPEWAAQADGHYGYVVSVSADGCTMAVGEPGRVWNDIEDCGAVYLYRRTDEGAQWVSDVSLRVKGQPHAFGCAVSLDHDGSTLVVGARRGNVVEGSETCEAGTAYLYCRDTERMWPVAGTQIVPPPGHGDAEINFGYAVSVSGDGQTIAIGAPDREAETAAGAGRVYFYDGTGQYVADTGADEADARFGFSVSLNFSGQIVAVGAPGFDAGKGAWCVLESRAGSWPEPVWNATGEDASARLGHAVSLSANGLKLAVSAPGTRTVDIRTPDDTNELRHWSSQKVLDSATADDAYGVSVSLSADGLTLAVGAKGDDNVPGKVHLYRQASQDDADWQRLGPLEVDVEAGDAFGAAVSLSGSGNSLVAGAPLRSYEGTVDEAGAVSMFNLVDLELDPDPLPEPGEWVPQAFGRYGYVVSVSADGCTMAVGEPGRKWGNVENSGAVYLYGRARKEDDWELDVTLREPDQPHAFGCAVSLDHDGLTLVVGARRGDVIEGGETHQAGVAYLYRRNRTRNRNGGWPAGGIKMGPPSGPIDAPVNGPINFGYAVSISGDGRTIAVGAPDQSVAASSGMGHVYFYDETGRYRSTLIVSSEPASENARFGFSVSLNHEGDFVAVGGPGYSSGKGAWCVWRVQLSGGPWVGTWKGQGEIPDGNLGHAVSLSANGLTLAVSAAGSRTAYVCAPEDGSNAAGPWIRKKELSSGVEDDAYGASVSLSADGMMLAVGASGSEDVPGTVCVYEQGADVSDWSEQEPLDADVETGDEFGAAVSLSADGSCLVAGAPWRSGEAGAGVGATATFTLERSEPEPEPEPEPDPEPEPEPGVEPILEPVAFWDEVLFDTGDQPARLARRDAHPEKTDGVMRPHQAFMLAFLRMLQTPRAMFNAIPAAHRQLYYRDLLGLKERPVAPDRVAVNFTLAEAAPELLLPAGTLLDAGQDSEGALRHYRLERDILANQGQLTDMRWYRPAAGDDRPTTRIVYDLSGGVLWPEPDVQLFDADKQEERLSVTGCVVGSPVLSMAGGERAVTVTFAQEVGDAALIMAQVSSGGTWLPLANTAASGAADAVTFRLGADAAALTPPLGLDGFSDDTPLIRLSHEDGLVLPQVTGLAVAVTQAPDVLYNTDEGEARLNGISYPFRRDPVTGAGMNLVSADWCGKPYAVTVTVTPVWANLPETSFEEWYAAYPEAYRPETNAAFQAQAWIVTRGARTPVELESLAAHAGSHAASQESLAQQAPLFADGAPPEGNALRLSFTSLPAVASDSGSVKDWQAWLRLELSGSDFLHKHYGQALQEADDPAAVNPPYTPQLSALRVDYAVADAPVTAQYVLTPFGYRSHEEVLALVSGDAEAAAQFGYAVSLSGDGNTLAVGAPYRTERDAVECGAVYLFDRLDEGWVQQVKLLLPDSEAPDTEGVHFGHSVSLDHAGRTLAVGTPKQVRGRVYLYSRESGGWNPTPQTVAYSKSTAGRYGHAVSLSGDGRTLAIGEPEGKMYPDDSNSTVKSGLVHLYDLIDKQWRPNVYLPAVSFAVEGAKLGTSVSLNNDGTVLAVGAPGYVYEGVDCGAIHLFRCVNGVWTPTPQQSIGDVTTPRKLGTAVRLSSNGHTLVAGESREPGERAAVHVFRRVGQKYQGWRQFDAPVADDRFGRALALSADGLTLAIGAPGSDDVAGRVYRVQCREDVWQEPVKQEIAAFPLPQVDAGLGWAVALDAGGTRLVSGAPGQDIRVDADDVLHDAGALYEHMPDAPQLYLGFMGLQPGQDINLYWQLQSPQPLKLHWEYLNRANQWRSLNAEARDDTGGLFESGQWSCVLPADAADNVAHMPPGRHWIRTALLPSSPSVARFPDPASDFPRLLGLHANAALAVLVDGDLLDATHFEQTLPAYTITRTVQPTAGLAEVTQPWPSFGGRGPESEAAFLQRATQRLQNRARVLTWRDVRNLLREHFPEIHDVRMPMALWAQTAAPGASINERQLVVIPANGRMDNNDALRPAFNPARLARMQAYLQQASSPWMQLVPLNPSYVDVAVDYEVVFKTGVNADYGYRQLRLALEKRYMPWSWDDTSTVVLGDQLDYYDMVAFIQSQPWVERVRHFTLGNGNVSIIGKDDQVLILAWPDEEDLSESKASRHSIYRGKLSHA